MLASADSLCVLACLHVCRGSKRISLRVPPGVDEGSRLRVRGEGDAGRR